MKKYFVYLPFYLLSLLPLGILYAFSYVFSLLIYEFLGYRVKVVSNNLKRAFPDKSQKEINEIKKDFYRYFTDMFMENMKFLSIGKYSMTKRLKVVNPELIESYFTEGKSVIVYMAHVGNWEMMCGLPIYFSEKILSLYQPLKNSYMDGLIKIIRSRFGVEMVPSKNGYRTIVNYSKSEQRTISYLVGDQCPHRGAAKYWGNLFNSETAFLIGTDRIARKTNQAVVYLKVTRPKKGFQNIEFIPLSDSAKELKQNEVIDLYCEALEENIREQPEIWLWSHKRWKYTREESEQ